MKLVGYAAVEAIGNKGVRNVFILYYFGKSAAVFLFYGSAKQIVNLAYLALI